jgi:GTP-sensing pleiotropic transcriptional regulator CodY
MTHILFYQLGNSYYSELKAILLILEKIDNSEVLFIEDVAIEMNQITANIELVNLYKKQLSSKNEFIKPN